MSVLQKNRSVIAVVSILVIIGAVLVITLRQFNRNAVLNTDPLSAAGEVLADETHALLGGHGQVVVVTYDAKKSPMPVAAAQVKTFQERLQAKGGVTVKAVEVIQISPDPGTPAWSGTQYSQLVERHAGVDAIVSFVGAPVFSDAELRQLPARLPKGIVFGNGDPKQPLRALFQRGVVQVAVIPRFVPPRSLPGSSGNKLRDVFEQMFQIVRTDTAGTLPY